MSASPESDERKVRLVEAALLTLREHFDSVVIVATWPAGNGNWKSLSQGSGNWYARVASVEEWLSQRQEQFIGPAVSGDEGGETDG